MEARQISVQLRRDPREIAERHSQANPLTLSCVLARSEEVEQNLSLYAELHASRTPASVPLAAVGPVSMTTGSTGPWELDFTSAQMNQTVLPGEDVEFWLVVYATSATAELFTLATIRLTLQYDNISQVIPPPPEPSIAGNVFGPASSTDNALARFDGTTGKLLQNSAATLTDAGLLTVPDASVTGTLTVNHIHGNLAGAVYSHVRNESGGPLTKGTPVYIVGYSVGQSLPLVAAANAASAATMPAIGILDANLANNASGHAVILGTIENINTAAYSVNAPLYVASGGGLTATAPSVRAQSIAIVERVNANNGAIIVTAADVSGSMAQQSSANVSITGGSITGITDLAIADGGTGASTAAGARANLELMGKLSPELPTMWVWDNGAGRIYVRMAFDATYDLAISWIKNSGINSNLQMVAIGTVLKSSSVGGTPTISQFETSGDETTGWATTGNGRAGGGHGLEICRIIKTSHGYTSADIGKRFQDTNSRRYCIATIVDANTLWMAENPVVSSGNPQNTAFLPPAGTTLTALDGQADLTGWTASTQQGPPGSVRIAQQFLVDGRPLNAGEIAECRVLELVEYSETPNIRNAYNYFNTNGSTAQWSDVALGNMWTRRVAYRHYPWGEMVVENTGITVSADIKFSEVGDVQFNPPTTSQAGGSFQWAWVPGIASKATTVTINGTPNATIDLNQPFYLGTVGGTVTWAVGDTIISGVLPDFTIHLLSTSSSSHSDWRLGHFTALDPTWIDGVPATRITTTESFLRMISTKKTYPYSFSRTATFPAGTTVRTRSSRRWVARTTEVDFWTFVRSGDGFLVYAAWTTAPGSVSLPLPAYLHNKTISSVRVRNGSIVSTNTAAGSLTINGTSNAGFIIARLS